MLKSEAFAACKVIRESLSDDELVYAAFLRHVHAHVYQTGFEYAIERGNAALNQPAAIRTNQMVPTVRRHVSVDEVQRIVDEIDKAFAGDEWAILAHFVKKTRPGIEWLHEAMGKIDAERARLSEAG